VPGAEGEDEEVVRLQDEGPGDEEPPLADDAKESGEMAVRDEHWQTPFRPRAGRATRLRPATRERPDALPRTARPSQLCARGRGLGATSAENHGAESVRTTGEVMRARAAETPPRRAKCCSC